MDYDFPDDIEEIVKPFNPFTFQVQPLEVKFFFEMEINLTANLFSGNF